jgi:S1-C subfamily serine protease
MEMMFTAFSTLKEWSAMSRQINSISHTVKNRDRPPWAAFAVILAIAISARCASASTVEAVISAEPKMVKVYGAGGVRGLEAYQSGFLISADGHVLTAWSYVLDTDTVIVTLHDGRRFDAKLIGADPRVEIAVLKIDARPSEHFVLSDAVTLQPGDRILAFSNLYGIATGDEATSVLHGSVSATTHLAARRGVFKTPYEGPVYILDAVTNNSGAAGGALTDHRGRIAGVLGKELRSIETNAWLNYAVPVSEIRDSVRSIIDGITIESNADSADPVERPWRLRDIGLRLVPNVMTVTPPYVESVVAGSAADTAGLQSDDLIMYLNKTLVRSRDDLEKQLALIERDNALSLAILRDQKLIMVEIDGKP